MRGFIRYFCFYCASRLIYETARGLARRKSKPAPACKHHGDGLLLMLASLPFVGIALLLFIGSLVK